MRCRTGGLRTCFRHERLETRKEVLGSGLFGDWCLEPGNRNQDVGLFGLNGA